MNKEQAIDLLTRAIDVIKNDTHVYDDTLYHMRLELLGHGDQDLDYVMTHEEYRSDKYDDLMRGLYKLTYEVIRGEGV